MLSNGRRVKNGLSSAESTVSKKGGEAASRGIIASFKNTEVRDFPGGALVKKPSANAGDTGSSPVPGRSHKPQSS